MAVFMISAKPAFLPAPDDCCGWNPCWDGCYRRAVGPHTFYAQACLSDTGRKQRLKQEALAGFVRRVQEQESGVPRDQFYLIAHDKDLLKAGTNDEGIYPLAAVAQVGSSLASLLPDRHIYAFQHVPRQDMFETLIAALLDDLDEAKAESALDLICNCPYETSVS